MFVTARSAPSTIAVVPPPEDTSERDSASLPAAPASAVAGMGNDEERDILEEDLNDLEYVPYKMGGQPGRGRGRPPKSSFTKK